MQTFKAFRSQRQLHRARKTKVTGISCQFSNDQELIVPNDAGSLCHQPCSIDKHGGDVEAL
ncbi:hypothetical protein O9992_28550 [Vibrio lentus]|nr:hypothetical protein [Vibrio lentus]